jgi:hypothetical protein
MIDSIPTFKAFVDTYVSGFGFVDTSQISHGKRMYGIGAGLDVAELRFSAVLCSIAYITSRIASTTRKKYISIYLICFVIISLVGNMIARTTTMGVALSLAFWTYALFSPNSRQENIYLWKWLTGIIIIALLIIVPLYNTSPTFRANTRFAFEGFFSLVEKGHWEVHSNEILKNMYVFPENLKTWVIGDGYIENPYLLDPNYVGPRWGGYYMATDIGYLRFIFYFGLIGMLTFCYFFYRVGKNCMDRFSNHKILFLMIMAVHFIVWCKVATDLFVVFALFLVIGTEENEEYEKRMLQA